MKRCIFLAQKAKGYTGSNPMVGSVIVHNNQIIGEGYHRIYGGPHAEVNAINSVKDKSLLSQSTLYVSLEPCAHYGKTPPCAELIVKSRIPRVVIGSTDPFPKVSGRGLDILRSASIETIVGVLEEECKDINKAFFFAQSHNQPYVILKWAQTKDGFIDKKRTSRVEKPFRISSDFTSILSHKQRSEVDAILVGTNTAILDNPRLDTRSWKGKNPIRIVLDKNLILPNESHLLDESTETIVVTHISNENIVYSTRNKKYIFVSFTYDLVFWQNLFEQIKKLGVQSLLVEGGTSVLQSLISLNLWSEAHLEISEHLLESGIEAPKLIGNPSDIRVFRNSKKIKYLNNSFKNL